MRVASIDGDELCYVVGFAIADEEPVHNAYYTVNTKIKNICTFLETDLYNIYLTGRNNFRKDVATLHEYKGKRKDTPKPKYWQEIRDYLIGRHKAITYAGWEADDCLSLAASADSNHIICTQDKDLRQIPGYYVNPYKLKEQGKPRCIIDGVMEPLEAEASLAEQVIKGDAIDCIPSMSAWTGVKARRGLYQEIKDHPQPLDMATNLFWENCQKKWGAEAADWALWEQLALLTMLTDTKQYDEIQTKLKLRAEEDLPWDNWRNSNDSH